MPVRSTSLMAALATGAACAALAACSPSAPEQSAPPPPPPEAAPPPLAGGPPAILVAPAGPVVVTMAPIPNPGDLSPADRRRVYGPGYRQGEGRPHEAYRAAPAYRVGPVYRVAPDHRLVPLHAARAPIVAPAPHAVAIAPTHVAPPTAHPVAAPVVAAPAKPPTKLAQMQAVVGPAVAQGSQLSVSPEVAQGKPGGVSLSLPANLLDLLRGEAAKLGLRHAARHADVSATLSGDGYAVTPASKQTQALQPGQAAKFSWQVTPGMNATGPLRAQVDASLKGQGAPKLLSLATLQSAASQAASQAEQAAGGLHMPSLSHLLDSLFGHKDAVAPAPAAGSNSAGPLHERTLPIIGRLSVRAQIAAFLAFLAILILLLIQRNMAEQKRAAERRRYRSMKSDSYKPMDLDAEPPPAGA